MNNLMLLHPPCIYNNNICFCKNQYILVKIEKIVACFFARVNLCCVCPAKLIIKKIITVKYSP